MFTAAARGRVAGAAVATAASAASLGRAASRSAAAAASAAAPTSAAASSSAAAAAAAASSVAASVAARRALSSSGAAGAKPAVAFLGLGQMGARMARNLVKAGHTVVAYDVSEQAVADLAPGSSQVVAAATPAEAAAKAEGAVVTMLPSSPHVREVYAGANGIFEGLAGKEGMLLIDSSTIDPLVAQEVARAAAEVAKADMVDAPVSGGVGGAEAGTLTFMVGGSEAAFERSKPVLEPMGANIVHCGDNGTGQIAKVCNNLVLGISMIGVSEAFNLGINLGADPKKLAGILNTSTARCWSSDTYNPVPGVIDGVPASNNWEGGFGVDLMAKDLGLAVQAAEQIKAPVPLGAAARQFYALVSAHGGGRKDFGYAFKYLNKTSGGDDKN